MIGFSVSLWQTSSALRCCRSKLSCMCPRVQLRPMAGNGGSECGVCSHNVRTEHAAQEAEDTPLIAQYQACRGCLVCALLRLVLCSGVAFLLFLPQ